MEFEGLLDLSKPHTDLEVIDAATKFLLAQATRSVSSAGGHCKYRGMNGTKCAIGAFIPDKVYCSDMECMTITDLVEREIVDPESLLGKFIHKHFEVLNWLQFIHDHSTPVVWTEKLALMRERYERCCLNR